MALACEALGIPVVSGNVSLYNETDGRAIDPTPVVGCVGRVEDVRHIPGAWREGDGVYLAAGGPVSLNGSEYQALYGSVGGAPALLDLDAEAELIELLVRIAPAASLLHDAAEGGFALALAEAAIYSGVSAELSVTEDELELFGEGGGRVVVASAEPLDLPRIGTVGGDTLLGVPLAELAAAWSSR
jgi:phosphoribosylformylglycinamidine synthase